MPRSTFVYRFGAFELDPVRRWLTHGAERVHITPPQWALLMELTSHAPDVVSKEKLAKAGWGRAPTDNSIEQAISRLRKALRQNGRVVFIETVSNHGYRFVAQVQQVEPDAVVSAGGDVDEAIRAFVQGRRGLPTLTLEAMVAARGYFELTLRHAPDHPQTHVGLANACAFIYEASRVDASCDLDALTYGVEAARRATILDPTAAEAWSTHAFVLHLAGETDRATVSAWKAVTLDPDGWRHRLRLAYLSWGEGRIEAAHAALSLRPDLAFAHWLKATVLIARGALEAALLPLRAGCIAQDKQKLASATYPAVGLHLLHGLVLAAQNRLADAIREFECELAGPDSGQLYARQRTANTWYALGAVHLRRGELDRATVAFRKALEIGPGHFPSMAALMLPIPDLAPTDPRIVDAALARAIAFARAGRHPEAAQAYRNAVVSAPNANAGWILPVEPILHVQMRPEIWSDALTLIQQRAT